MDIQSALDRMLENENLTNNLEDDDADFLLNWGAEQVRHLAAKTADETAANEKVNHLMAAMRSLNHIAGNLESVGAEDLSAFFEKTAVALGTAKESLASDLDETAAKIAAMSPHDALEHLLNMANMANLAAAPTTVESEVTTVTEPPLDQLQQIQRAFAGEDIKPDEAPSVDPNADDTPNNPSVRGITQ